MCVCAWSGAASILSLDTHNQKLAHRTEFNKIALVTAFGFIIAGFIGFFVKLIFIVSTAGVREGGCVLRD